MWITKGTVVEFIAFGKPQKFEILYDAKFDIIEESIIERFGSYRESSLCFNGVNAIYPNVTSGYLLIEGKIGDRLLEQKKETWYSIKDVRNMLKYGIQKGDTLHLGGVSNFKVTEVDYGNQLISISVE